MVNISELQYLRLLEDILKTGYSKNDRTGIGTLSKFGGQLRFDLEKSFPLFTTRKMYWKGIVEELLWFLRGETDCKQLSKRGVNFWNSNGSRRNLDNLGFYNREEGDLGPIYGFQWKHFGASYVNSKTKYKNKGIDQIENIIQLINNEPHSRRIILSAWNPLDINLMCLPPCHVLAQFYVHDKRLSCQLYQRSCDMGLGIPFNIASYSLLTYILAKRCHLNRGEFIISLGDMHIYNNHKTAISTLVKRPPFPFPCLKILKEKDSIEEYLFEDFMLENYVHYPNIKMEMCI